MEKRTGVVIPLAALYTKDCEAVGDFMALKPFADFCQACGFSVIQLLPVNDTGTQSSPYSGLSAFALHPLYIRIESLPEFEGALQGDKAFASAYKTYIKSNKYKGRFDYDKLTQEKYKLLHLLYSHAEKLAEGKKTASKTGVNVVNAGDGSASAIKFKAELENFAEENGWVIAYAVFKNLKDSAMQASWKSWDEHLQKLSRDQIMLRFKNKALKSSHNFFVWCQMRAAQQFKEAADYVKSKGILLKGDIPILMNEDSTDCWAWPEFFNQDLRAGSPPDGENPSGQNWGFPTYNWARLEADEFNWWKNRIKTASQYYSAFRIDHILGFFRIWAVKDREGSAYLGHTEPYASLSRKELNALGFDDSRLRWLSQPHIPTGLIEDITWNHDEAHRFLSLVADRLGDEELWLFKKDIGVSGDIYTVHFCDDISKDANVKRALEKKWNDRCLIEIEDNTFIPVYTYENSTAWKSLGWDEQQKLRQAFDGLKEKENSLWKEQALSVLTPIVHASSMIPCAEDLGVNLAVMPEVLKQLEILSLKVVRWNRLWEEDGQPYYPLEKYPELSVATTSVHDSSTVRQWWQDEKQSVQAFIKAVASCEGEADESVAVEPDMPFDEKVAAFVMENSAKCASALFINPLQDYLYLQQKYFLEDAQSERINVPGSVNAFNWTYRMPVSVEALLQDEEFIQRVQKVVKIHDGK